MKQSYNFQSINIYPFFVKHRSKIRLKFLTLLKMK